MPTPALKKIAKETGKPLSDVESKWRRIKRGLSKKISKDDPKFYPILMTTVRKALKNKKNKKNKKENDNDD